jgi:hypothetical protein
LAVALVLAAGVIPMACTTTEPVGEDADDTTTTAAAPPPTATTVPLEEYDVEAQDCSGAPPREGTAALIDQFVALAGITEEGEPYEGCARYEDETGVVAVEVPESWEYIAPVPLEGGIASLQARPEVSGDPADPVIAVSARETDAAPDLDATLLQVATSTTGESACVAQQTGDFADGVFTGRAKAYVDCADGRAWLFVVARPDDGAPYTMAVFGQVATLADVEALEHALDTFDLVA